jgi:hypothetical protein
MATEWPVVWYGYHYVDPSHYRVLVPTAYSRPTRAKCQQVTQPGVDRHTRTLVRSVNFETSQI